MPAGNIADLDMSDVRHASCQGINEISLGHLGVVDVILQLDLRMIDLPDDAQSLRCTMQDILWKIRFVERLEDEG